MIGEGPRRIWYLSLADVSFALLLTIVILGAADERSACLLGDFDPVDSSIDDVIEVLPALIVTVEAQESGVGVRYAIVRSGESKIVAGATGLVEQLAHLKSGGAEKPGVVPTFEVDFGHVQFALDRVAEVWGGGLPPLIVGATL